MKLDPHRVGREDLHDSPVLLDYVLTLFDPLLARPAFVVEGDDSLSGTAHVGDDEADARNKLARMPLDLAITRARLGPACRLVDEIGVVPPGRSAVVRPGA
jgi:hypothetical protein